jgi:hypothetical protein
MTIAIRANLAMPLARAATPVRQSYVDLLRGLLIAHMALDHASLMFNAWRGAEELAAAAPGALADFFPIPHAFQWGAGSYGVLLHGWFHGGADQHCP